MGRRKGEKIMKIPAEFEDILRGVELTEREKRFLRWITSWDDHTMQNMRTVVEKVRSTLSTLQAENGKLRAELKSKVDLVFQQAKELDRRHLLLQEQEADLEQVKRERDELERFLGELEGAVYTGQYFHLRSMIEKWRGQKED
jgi:transposase